MSWNEQIESRPDVGPIRESRFNKIERHEKDENIVKISYIIIAVIIIILAFIIMDIRIAMITALILSIGMILSPKHNHKINVFIAVVAVIIILSIFVSKETQIYALPILLSLLIAISIYSF